MDWDRVRAARRRGRALFVIAAVAILATILLLIAAPAGGTPRNGFGGPDTPGLLIAPIVIATGIASAILGPDFLGILITPMLIARRIAGAFFGPDVAAISLRMLVIPSGIAGVLFGLAWMWRIYKAPTKLEGAHWRFRDHS